MERLLGEQQFSTAATVAAQVNYELASRLDTLQRVAALAANKIPALAIKSASLFLGGIYGQIFR